MNHMHTVTICIPIWNEQENIGRLLDVLEEQFDPNETLVRYVIVDDSSFDNSGLVIKSHSSKDRILLLTNEENLGHGPSVLIGLRNAITLPSDYFVTLDGDGQLDVSQFGKHMKTILSGALGQFDVCEFSRQGRSEGPMRTLLSWLSRIYIFVATGLRVADANTPVRIYRSASLKRLLSYVPLDAKILAPNILFSITTREQGWHIASLPLNWGNPIGSPHRPRAVTWGKGLARVKKLAIFALRAWIQIHQIRAMSRGR